MTSPPTTVPARPTADDSASPSALTSREIALALAVLAAAVALIALLGGSILWTRPLWLDEWCCSVFPAIDARTPVDVITNVTVRSWDYSPPLLHLMVWTAGRLAGGITPVALRTMSAVCVGLALVVLYASLRRRFDRLPSAAGPVAVASHWLVVAHAFEARFYGPWLLFASLYAWTLGLRHSRARDVLQATAAVLLCTIHWFGVLSLGLMAVGALATHGRQWRTGLRAIAPSAVGILVLSVFLPSAFAQRGGAEGMDVLWVPQLSRAQVTQMVQLFFLAPAPVLAAILLLLASLRDENARANLPAVGALARHALRDRTLAALAALSLMPLVLMVISVLLQPSMLDRYAIVTLLTWAPLVALGVATLSRGVRAVVLVGLVALVVRAVGWTIAEKAEFASVVAANQSAFDLAETLRLPIVFPSIHAVYPVAARRRKDRVAHFLDLPDSTIDALFPRPGQWWLRRHLRLERNITRGHARTYDFPVLATQAQLDTTSRFLLVASDESLPRTYKDIRLFVAAVFPRHDVRRLSQNLSLVERRE